MARPNSTVVVVVGESAGGVVAGLDGLANVRAVTDADTVGLAVGRSHSAYVVHHADPLAEVGAAWAGFFDGTAPTGTLEVAVEAALARLRTDAVTLPDYYVVLDPDGLADTAKHWWFGVLAGASPNRVVPSAASVGAVRDVLSALAPGRWWPDPPDEWLHGLARVVPDRALH
ncbi:hypothetical protein [Jiangella asiatica]|uniref:Uncharacterized protein n=1 Tax=Jiangella asiatica TaxID=2530372 RepID=A0A4R5DK25_9ACTN|nr:hypothetical protein [Jiangella asiatica]TDE10963.1 hypothetical protein E1269_10815 [Jiangella asiatica]